MRSPPRHPADLIVVAVARINATLLADQARRARIWELSRSNPEPAFCDCGCMLLYPGEHCPNCEIPMPRTRTA